MLLWLDFDTIVEVFLSSYTNDILSLIIFEY